ncbi:unnamed protein product (macronuclear) [Paramecium tetraurelia]|uniref:Uncharacterized protein n=1 Tax=Paramecium tetraurelia TaxID=5888 RepID=A0E760_PARTE|nr:uncharacterized protein GSPATT00023855001 [Paramecium tetraurelia]CAK91127.1 unnamed protein product [Paramecium tetraurelia]|eukprot:XP_001458524.1 hypothetical protein (macronuclear) [Paramecium tetraurelia strain d4-2]
MIDPQLMEKWKTELFQDQALNKLFDQHLTLEEFVLLILKNYNMVQLGDIFQKLTSINQSISMQLDHYIKNNYELLIEDLKDKSQQCDNDVIIEALQKIKFIQQRLQDNYVTKYNKIIKLLPIKQNSELALQKCKQLQKFSVQLKLLRSLAQQQNNSINITDAQRVSNALFEIDRLPIKQFQFYKNNQTYIKQVEETLQIKVTRKFEDSLSAKSVPDLTQCLGIFYSLGRLSEILELKCNQVLKQISEQYKILFSNSKSFLPDYRNQIKNELNQMILIWLIYQAMNQTDQYHLINYQEELKDQFPHLFLMVWKKYTDVIQQSIQIIIDNKQKYESTYNNLVHFYPIIKDIYYDQLIMFSEQILIFPSSILLSLNQNEIQGQLMSSLNVLRPLHQMQFILLLKEQITNLANDVYVQEKGQPYVEKALNALTSFIDFVKLEFEQIKYDGQSFKFMTQKLLHEYNSLIESFQGMTYTNECLAVLSVSMPYFWKQLLDHPLNHELEMSELLVKKEGLKQIDSNLQILFDQYLQRRKITQDLINALLKN